MIILLKDVQFLGDISFWQRIQHTFNTGRVYYCQLIIFCNLGVPSLISVSHECPDQKAKVYACVILALRDIGALTLWNRHPSGVKDNATSLDNIKDACDGKAVSRSKYVCIISHPSPNSAIFLTDPALWTTHYFCHHFFLFKC